MINFSEKIAEFQLRIGRYQNRSYGSDIIDLMIGWR